jgi:hypothetical protein
VADQTHPGHIDDPVFCNSFLRPSVLRVRFRKMTGVGLRIAKPVTAIAPQPAG